MTPAARLAAAIEVFAAIENERRPAADVLKAWGLTHRFAGSSDRAAIAGLVYDGLRRRASSAFLMGADTPRAVLLGMLRRERGLNTDAIARLADGSQYAPEVLSPDERKRLDAGDINGAPPYVVGDYPEWLEPHFLRAFGDNRADEGTALASRAPLDLRVNTLKAEREAADTMLSDLKSEPARWSPWGLRIRLSADAKSPAIHAELAFIKGLVEVQDEGSQLAALFSAAKPGEQVLDLCAGAGGKTLAMAAMMQNKGQIFATDDDKRRLASIHERLKRSGARNVQVRTPKSVGGEIDDLAGRMKKARAWLDKHSVDYAFHDYKSAGIERDRLERWANKVGWETLLNRAGTTFKKLPDKDKAGLSETKAIALMLKQPSMIKRPVLDTGRGKLLVGFKPEQYTAVLG